MLWFAITFSRYVMFLHNDFIEKEGIDIIYLFLVCLDGWQMTKSSHKYCLDRCCPKPFIDWQLGYEVNTYTVTMISNHCECKIQMTNTGLYHNIH